MPDRSAALFLDFDGTLVPIAATPDSVRIAPTLPALLQTIAQQLGGAAAVLSGRQVSEIDHLLQPLHWPVAGVHGAERRGADGYLRRLATPDLSPAQGVLEALVQTDQRLVLERKRGALALHYRGAAERESACIAAMTAAAQRVNNMVLMRGKMVVELKPRRASKGQALRSFMDERPFRSRTPWMFGDDVTDESAFEAVLCMGGVAVKIGPGDTLAPYRLDNPAALHSWLAMVSDTWAAAQGSNR